MSRMDGVVATARADRYLTQIVEHLGQLAGHSGHGGQGDHAGHAGPPPVLASEQTGDIGLITFAWGTCTLGALPGRLELSLEGDDPVALEQGAQQLTHRLETIGRRDGLQVVWDRAP